MPQRARRHTSTAILGLCALASFAFAPSPESTEGGSGECLHGYAYATVAGTPVGLTSDTCYKQTDCQEAVGSGPKDGSHGPVTRHHHVHVPVPHGTDVTCYL